jgi:uncharacterized membrane protein YdbT with pleckstrin-like domain
MSAGESLSTTVDPAIPLASDESALWTGRPRVTVVLPAAIGGLALVLAGLAGMVVFNSVSALALVPAGLAVSIGRYLRNQRTQYVVTDYALYKKTGVLSRTVSQAALTTVQNSSYSQSITGSLFGYGAVEFEIAGGGSFAYQTITNPQAVRTLVAQATEVEDSLTGESTERQVLPGRLEQWQAVRDEVRLLHRSLKDHR